MIAQSVGLVYNTSMGKNWNMNKEGRAKISAYAQQRYKNNSVITNCKRCSKEYKVGLSRWNNGRGRYCSKDCMTADFKGRHLSPQSEFQKGQTAWNKGLDCVMTIGKGDDVGYKGLHLWVQKQRGKPTICEFCGDTSKLPQDYQWANLSGDYLRDIQDWARLCRSCHAYYDIQHKSNRKEIFTNGNNK